MQDFYEFRKHQKLFGGRQICRESLSALPVTSCKTEGMEGKVKLGRDGRIKTGNVMWIGGKAGKEEWAKNGEE